jgi:hypothetical protein
VRGLVGAKRPPGNRSTWPDNSRDASRRSQLRTDSPVCSASAVGVSQRATSASTPSLPAATATDWSPRASRSGPGPSNGAMPVSKSASPPAACTRVGWSGTTNSSRPCSRAQRAVMSDPDRSPASITTVALASPEMTRFRCGNVLRSGRRSGGNSLTISPPADRSRAARSASAPLNGTPRPCATTATVRPSAPRWAASSMPHASPLTTTPPARTTSSATRWANWRAGSLHRRAPTMAAAVSWSSEGSPSRNKTGGAKGSDRSHAG